MQIIHVLFDALDREILMLLDLRLGRR